MIIGDNFSYFSMKPYVVTPHLNRLGETVHMMGHNIRFKGAIWKIIPKFFLLSLLIWSTEVAYATAYLDKKACQPLFFFVFFHIMRKILDSVSYRKIFL